MRAPTLFSLAACACLLGSGLVAQGAVRRPATPQEPNPHAVLQKVMQRFDRLESALKQVTEALKKSEQVNQAQERRLRGLEQAAKKPAPQAQAKPPLSPKAPATPMPPRRIMIQQAPQPGPGQPPAAGPQVQRRLMLQQAPVRTQVRAMVAPQVQELREKAQELRSRIQTRVQQGPTPPPFQGRAQAARPQAEFEAGRALAQRVLAQLHNLSPAARQAFFQEMAKMRRQVGAPQGRGQAGPPAHTPRHGQRGGRQRI